MTASNRQVVALPCGHILRSCRYRGPSTPVATATCAQDDRTREAALVGAPSKIIHHGDTEDTEFWFPQSFLRDLRAGACPRVKPKGGGFSSSVENHSPRRHGGHGVLVSTKFSPSSPCRSLPRVKPKGGGFSSSVENHSPRRHGGHGVLVSTKFSP